jgi:hypothetical protein
VRDYPDPALVRLLVRSAHPSKSGGGGRAAMMFRKCHIMNSGAIM